MTRLTAFIVALLLTSPAWGQGALPPTPYHSVWGRLGAAPGDTGPAQAIPFATLGAQLFGAGTVVGGITGAGQARMWPSLNQSTSPTVAWNALDPQGNSINCAATTTQCLQEFLNAATANGWVARIYCQGTQFPGAAEPIFINVVSPVVVNVNQDWSFEAHGCNLNGVLTTSSLLTLNSSGNGHFIWEGKIVYTVTSPVSTPGPTMSCAVMINPTTNTGDGFPGLYSGLVWITTPVSIGSGGTAGGVVCINTATGSSIQEELKFGEVNGTNSTAYGIIAFSPSGTTGLIESIITATQVHGSTVAAVQEGTSATNQTNLKNNLWKIGSIQTFSGIGIDSYGSNDNFNIGSIDGSQGVLATGINIRSGAVRETFNYGSIVGASVAAISDAGTCSTYQGAQGSREALEGSTSGCAALMPPASGGGVLTFPAGAQTIAATTLAQTWTASQTNSAAGGGNTAAWIAATSSGAAFAWEQSGGGADAKWWDIISAPNALQYRAVNDAQTIANIYMTVNRSGATITNVTFPTPVVLNTPLSYASGGTNATSLAGAQANFEQAYITATALAVDFNTVADTGIAFTMPAGFTRLLLHFANISHASHSLTTAQFGVFTATAGGGQALIASGTAITVSATADQTANNAQDAAGLSTISAVTASLATPNTLYFRVTNAEGAAATADVSLTIRVLP